MLPPDRKAERRERLLDAAERTFTQQGLRGATMEAIAAAGGVAKATAYAYFRDKEDAFRAVAERLAARMARAVQDGLAAEGDPRTVLVGALQAKEAIAYRAAHASAHAHDLLRGKSHLAADAFARADAEVLAALAAHLTRLAVPDPAAVARRLLAACAGLAAAAEDEPQLMADIHALVVAVLAGLAAEA